MTREAAVMIARKYMSGPRFATGENLVDTLVALGLLKLEEPKSVEDEAIDVMRDNGDAKPPHSWSFMADLVDKLHARGFKIVREKP